MCVLLLQVCVSLQISLPSALHFKYAEQGVKKVVKTDCHIC